MLNVFMYGNEFVPHLPFRFDVDILGLGHLVKSVELPKFEINSDDGSRRFGNSRFVIPIYNFGDQKMSITFQETNNLDVTKTLMPLLNYMELQTPIKITVTEYDFTMKNITRIRKYVTRLLSCDSPSFSNDGSPSLVDINAEFIVDDLEEINDIDSYIAENAMSPTIDDNMQVKGEGFDIGQDYDEMHKQWEAYDNTWAERIKTRNDLLNQSQSQPEQGNTTSGAPSGTPANPGSPNGNTPTSGNNGSNTNNGNKPSGNTTNPPVNNKTTPTTPNSNNPLINAISSSYEAEVGKKEGERGHVFFDMIDADKVKNGKHVGAAGTINLGSGSSEGARGYSDVGGLNVTIDGKQMYFKDSASLNKAIQKAFGGQEGIIDVFKRNGGADGNVSKTDPKGIADCDKKTAKAELEALLKKTGGTIVDDNGNTSTIKMDKGLYMNVQLDDASSQKVSDKNIAVNTKGWSKEVQQSIIDNVKPGETNKVVQGMMHMQHAYSGFSTVWDEFNKDPSSVSKLQQDIKNGYFSQETLNALHAAAAGKTKAKTQFDRVIDQYGYKK